MVSRIVEYQTRDQAQNAVNTLSNQNLMGRLVYVREVRVSISIFGHNAHECLQDREAEPRFTGAASGRGGHDGGFGGGGRGGFQGGYSAGGSGSGAASGGGRQIFVNNVCYYLLARFIPFSGMLTRLASL